MQRKERLYSKGIVPIKMYPQRPLRQSSLKNLWKCKCLCGHIVHFQYESIMRGFTRCPRCRTKLVETMKRAVCEDDSALLENATEKGVYRRWAAEAKRKTERRYNDANDPA